jgi:cytochrome c-type biogenesis protein CcmH
VFAALAVVVAVPALAIPLYLKIGAVGLPDMPLAERREKAAAQGDLGLAVARIEAHLQDHPDDGRGWEVVAPYYLRSGRLEDGVHARAEALRLLGATATRHANLAEAQVVAAQGRVTSEAQGNFEAALALEPGDPMSRFYLGLGAAQDGDAARAKDIWTKLLDEAPPEAAYREIVRSQLDRLGGEGPASAAGAAVAAMPDAERAATIRSMVDRLAGRLAEKGDDVEGWLKLLRAYSVLGDKDKAVAALDSARKALAGKDDELARVVGLARELGIGEKAN